ncbi:hypothetical protein Tco_0704775 [Tanacetum coccineum]|uniref:Uncharacterized protein n=1 Tax=Tanacetum coccineum TaxID=301880 RepID=A0ABQ4Y2M7_9ASTR
MFMWCRLIPTKDNSSSTAINNKQQPPTYQKRPSCSAGPQPVRHSSEGTKRRTPRTQAIQQLHSNGQEAMIFNNAVEFSVLISLVELQDFLPLGFLLLYKTAHLLPANNSVDEVDSYMYQSLKMVQERQLRETEYDASPKHLKLVHVVTLASCTIFIGSLDTSTQREAMRILFPNSGRAILLMTGLWQDMFCAPERTTGSDRHLDESHRLQRVSSNGILIAHLKVHRGVNEPSRAEYCQARARHRNTKTQLETRI